MKQYKVGDEIKIYEILNNGGFAEEHTGKQVAALNYFSAEAERFIKTPTEVG